MAWSRLEKIGTIFSRVNGLLRAGALKEEDKPLWFELYKRFPPVDDPRFDRPASDVPIKQIFYPEDALRARFHKLYGSSYRTNLADQQNPSKCQQFLQLYNSLKENGQVPEEQLFDKAVDMLGLKTLDSVKTSREIGSSVQGKSQERGASLASTFRKAKEKNDKDIPRSTDLNIKDIFKES